MAMSPSAGVSYRCPLCTRRFAGRPHPLVYRETDPKLDPVVRPLTFSVASTDPFVLEHLQSHQLSEWVEKIVALEHEVSTLRFGTAARSALDALI